MRGGVIFDLDGVLIDSEELHFRAYSQVLGSFGVAVSRAEYGREWIAGGRGPEYAVRAYALPLSADALRALKAPVYRELLRAEARLMPGAASALTRLGARYALALATNSPAADVDWVVDYFDLRPFFAAVVAREQYRRAKPEPDAFLAAAAALGLLPARCVVVEDSLRGVIAAHRAGCACVAVPHAFTRDSDFSAAARVIPNLDGLGVAVVEALLAAGAAAG